MFSIVGIADITAGHILRETEERPLRVIHDSRLIQRGDLFVALTGARVDGHAYLQEAFSRGACGAIVSDLEAAPKEGRNLVQVDDPLRALQSLAAAWRKQTTAQFIGITGSCGKTTAKALLAHLLAEDLPVFAAPESFNTEIGLPLALLAMPPSAGVGIFELGTNAPGEIAPLAALLSPEIAVLTTIGRVHLEGFETVERIADEKWDLVRALPKDGMAIIPADCPELRPFLREGEGKLVSFGLGRGDVRGGITQGVPNLCVRIAKPALELASPLIGSHNATNLLAAVTCALHLGMSSRKIQQRVATFQGVRHRLQLVRAPFGYLLDDSYNANPEAVEAALRVLAELDLPVQQRAFVFGDMLELGEGSLRFHHEILELALSLGIAPIFPVGESATEGARGLLGRVPQGTIIFSTKLRLADRIRDTLKGDRNLLLVKGSRLLDLDKLVEELSG